MNQQIPEARNDKMTVDSAKVAKDAGLKYVTAGELGIHRRKNGRGFVYEDSRGARVTDPGALDRIRRLAIPPAC